MLLTITVIAAIAIMGYAIWKRGDQDGDGDIDINDIKISTKEIAEDIQEGVEGAIDTAEEAIDELKDVVSVITGKPTKSKLNGLTKKQLIDSALADHGVELDIKLTKSQLVNRVYKLYHG